VFHSLTPPIDVTASLGKPMLRWLTWRGILLLTLRKIMIFVSVFRRDDTKIHTGAWLGKIVNR
jgi:hypothetical protein